MRFDLASWIQTHTAIRHVSEGAKGNDLVVDCPLCGAPKKLYANEETGFWTCYRCSEGGVLWQLVAAMEDCDERTAKRLVTKLSAPRLGRSLAEVRAARDASNRRREAEHEPPAAPCELPAEFVPVWDEAARRWEIPSYLRTRGIRARTAARYGLGACATGRYAGRIIIPAHCGGVLRTFQGRSTDPDCPKEYRFLGPKGTRHAAVFGLDEADGAPELVVVEGAFDALRLVQFGIKTVGLMGKACAPAQVALLRAAGVRRVTLMLDGHLWTNDKDRRAMFKTATVLGALLEVRVAWLPPTLDPGSAPREAIEASLHTARPLVATAGGA